MDYIKIKNFYFKDPAKRVKGSHRIKEITKRGFIFRVYFKVQINKKDRKTEETLTEIHKKRSQYSLNA